MYNKRFVKTSLRFPLLLMSRFQISGKKPFLMGQRISNVDCAAFGILGQVMWGTPKECPGNALLVSKCYVLVLPQCRSIFQIVPSICN